MKLRLSNVLDWTLYASVAALLVLFISRKLSGPDEGELAAPFELPRADRPHEPFRLVDQRGKPVLIEILASWCGACRNAAPELREAWNKLGSERVTFVAISLDDDPRVAANLKRDWDIPYDVLVDDGKLAKSYQIEVLPTFVLVDAEGVVRHVSTGVPSSSEIERWVERL